MKIFFMVLLFPALLLAQADTVSVLIDRVKAGNSPGLIIALFNGQPGLALDTIGWQAGPAGSEPVTRIVLRGNAFTLPDSAGNRITEIRDFEVNWLRADTVFNVAVDLADTLEYRYRLVAGQLLPKSVTVADSLATADSLWRAGR